MLESGASAFELFKLKLRQRKWRYCWAKYGPLLSLPQTPLYAFKRKGLRRVFKPQSPYYQCYRGEMLGEGLEPTLLAEPDPKSGASANFATRARDRHVYRATSFAQWQNLQPIREASARGFDFRDPIVPFGPDKQGWEQTGRFRSPPLSG